MNERRFTMNKIKYFSISIAILILLFNGCSDNTTTADSSSSEEIESKIKIATFNIQIFGKTKRKKDDVMKILVKIVRNFDIVAVQEFRDKQEETLPFFVKKINEAPGDKYDFVGSKRLGRSSSKEKYAFIFNTKTVKYKDISFVYDDSSDVFEREPFVGYFNSGSFDYALINIHTKPDDATNEINALVDVIEDAETKISGEKDFIVLGDFNADCTYFKEEADASPLEASKYYWVIEDSADTTVKSTVCTYDRMVFIKSSTISDYAGKWEVFRFDQKYNLSQEQAVKVSDHYPVWAEFFTGKDSD